MWLWQFNCRFDLLLAKTQPILPLCSVTFQVTVSKIVLWEYGWPKRVWATDMMRVEVCKASTTVFSSVVTAPVRYKRSPSQWPLAITCLPRGKMTVSASKRIWILKELQCLKDSNPFLNPGTNKTFSNLIGPSLPSTLLRFGGITTQ